MAIEAGTAFCVNLPTDRTVFWLVVRVNHKESLTLVPCDDSPFCASTDVRVELFDQPAPIYARCNTSTLVHPDDLKRWGPVTAATCPRNSLQDVRHMLACLARGYCPNPATADENDPEYWELSAELEQLGLYLSNGRI